MDLLFLPNFDHKFARKLPKFRNLRPFLVNYEEKSFMELVTGCSTYVQSQVSRSPKQSNIAQYY